MKNKSGPELIVIRSVLGIAYMLVEELMKTRFHLIHQLVTTPL